MCFYVKSTTNYFLSYIIQSELFIIRNVILIKMEIETSYRFLSVFCLSFHKIVIYLTDT